MDYIAETTKLLLIAIFELTAILFVITVTLNIIKKFLKKITGKNEIGD